MASGHGLVFLEKLAGAGTNETLASAVLVGGLITAAGLAANAALKKKENPIVPDSRLSLVNFFELMVGFLISLGDNVMGKENRKYLPFVGTIFIYILFSNLLGLIPGFSMPTDSILFNLGIALVVFVLYNYWGIREVGAVAYFKHLLGPIWWIAPLLLVIEIISHIVRPISLSLRLFGNMTGDHIVLAVFTDLTKYVFPVIFYGLGTFVCLMQAFVFTLLTMIYIRFAVAHDEDH
ncbi:MAG: F0F1 ATP synthase subunit A [Bdellovibrionales bacterium]|nr:F0F1 ATP synthase subunit A [Bdellovibrionales bacterium]